VNNTSVGTPNERETPFFELASAGDWSTATVATGDRFTNDENDFKFLRTTFDAKIRDMELGAIAHIAFHSAVPVYSFKAITNVVGQGAMTVQYKENLPRCLDVLANETISFFDAI
jgi:nucleoside phosphorylase